MLKVLLVTIYITFLGLSNSYASISWKKAIQKVEKLQKKYSEELKKVGGYSLGTFYNELDVKQHQCSILGRMLGKTRYIKHLEQEYPAIDVTIPKAKAQELYSIAYISLTNWLLVAKMHLTTETNIKIKIWNYDCVGSYKIVQSAYIKDNSKLDFELWDNGKTLRILGDINNNYHKQVVNALNKYPRVETIALGSGGGYINQAILTGLEIRKRGLDTTLFNNCYSACPLVFLGGVRRVMLSPYFNLGFHQASRYGQAIKNNSPFYISIKKYVSYMGIKPTPILQYMFQASPTEMYKPDIFELCKIRVFTSVQRVC